MYPYTRRILLTLPIQLYQDGGENMVSLDAYRKRSQHVAILLDVFLVLLCNQFRLHITRSVRIFFVQRTVVSSVFLPYYINAFVWSESYGVGDRIK